LALLTLVWAASPALAVAQASPATVHLSTGTARPGDSLIVAVGGFGSPTTVTICGNNGLRGAVDCDQIGGIGLPASDRAIQQDRLVVTAPPAPCPCIVRAATAGDTQVVTTPLDIIGVATAPVVAPDVGAGADLRVAASVAGVPSSFFDRIRSAFGGRTERRLSLILTNTGGAALTGLTVSAAVSRGTQGGEPVSAPNIQTLQPGETRPYTIRVSLSTPAFGSYHVYGSVYGGSTPVSFDVTTTTTPWGLLVVAVLLVVDVGAIAAMRVRRRQQTSALREAQLRGSSKQTEVEQTESAAIPAVPPFMVARDALERAFYDGAP